MLRIRVPISLLVFTSVLPVFAQGAPATGDPEAAYTQTINERADKIVATLGIADAAQTARVRTIITDQYRGLRDITAPAMEPNNKREALHKQFIARLLAELTPEQVDKVKDGLTYGVVPLTFRVYQEMLPDLTDTQKRQIRAWLLEAREYAIDGGTSQEKHAWFGKYKGKINNFLSAAGYDMKKAEKDMADRNKARPAGTPPN